VYLLLDGEGPLYRQTYRALRRAIAQREFEPGTRLPATRVLADELGISRNTAIQAVEQLVAEGYAESRIGAGTFVAPELPETLGQIPEASESRDPREDLVPRLSSYGERALDSVGPTDSRFSWRLVRRPGSNRLPYDFRYGDPAFAEFPHEAWCRIVSRTVRNATRSQLAYGEPQGALELRRELVQHLRRTRGVKCDPEQVLLVHGSQQALDLCARLLLDPGEPVALEDPHYPGFRLSLQAAGARLLSIPVDQQGMRVDCLPATGARLACVTPSHQFPTGTVLPVARRLELLDWARRHDAFVLEDDYDGEFRYTGRPLESLQGLDRDGRVIYVGTASKAMFPALRIGHMVLPSALVRPFSVAKALADTGGATLEQRAFAEFIGEGHFERHLRRARTRNRARRSALVEAVGEHFPRSQIGGEAAGLHVMLELLDRPASQAHHLRRRAAEAGVGIYPIEPMYHDDSQRPIHAAFLLGYTSLEEPAIRKGVRLLAEAANERSLSPRVR